MTQVLLDDVYVGVPKCGPQNNYNSCKALNLAVSP